MITTRSRFFASRRGSAVIPSVSGMSMSRMTTSGSMRSTCSMASRPQRSEATSAMPLSASSQRASSPRTTTASSTTITRMVSSPREDWADGGATARLIAARIPLTLLDGSERGNEENGSDQPDFLELGLDDFLVEGLHDVFVGARVQRARDMGDVVLGGAEHDLGPVAVRHPAQRAQELVAVHAR